MALHAVSARHAMSENGALKREYAMKFQSRKFQTYVFSQAAKPLQGGEGELVKTNMKDHENACLSSMVNSEL